ncbi:MAG TPA: biotin/lipoate A/B protein ligase family protein [Xanthobacteraceae bacterium]|nr:biotin/lipoate A/B protein ligase family protein [Xanthobacteraceae bacterium]
MSALRVIDTGLRPPRRNVALTAALAELHAAGRIPDTLRFQRFEPCVLIGRNQDIRRAARLDRCAEKGVALARRLTGGGAVYMDAGVLSWQLVADRRRFGADLTDIAQKICGAVAGGLVRLGVEAKFSLPNAIVAEGRKISGASGYCEGTTLVHEGTVLIDFDPSGMADVLRSPGPGASAPRVTSLAAVLGNAPALGDVRRALAASISDCFGFSLLPEVPSARELLLAERLHAAEFGTDDFVFGEALEPAGALA